MDANIEYLVQKTLGNDCFLRLITLGIIMLFESSASETFSNKLKLRVRMNSDCLRLCEPVHITTGFQQARKLINFYCHYDLMMNDANQQQGAALPPRGCVGHLIERYPWIEFIEVLRKGGVDAAMNMIKKKAEVLRNLPLNQNNVGGIGFEEFQIAKMMAEFIRRGTPIELIAGDGQGSFQYNGTHMLTPEYTDAVFRNTVTDQFFAVQFKFTDDAQNLVSMIEKWQNTHAHKTPDPNLPEPLLLENVKLIGPNDVVNDLSHQNLGEKIRHRFEQNERIRFTSDNVNVVQQFLRDNKQLLQDILDSPDYPKHVENQKNVKMTKKNLSMNTEKLQQLENRLEDLQKKRSESVNNGEPTEGVDKGIMHAEGEISKFKTKIDENRQQLQLAEGDLKISENKMRSQIEQNINSKYREEFIKRAAVRELKFNVLVVAVIEGITTFICTFGDEYQKYKREEISLEQMIKTSVLDSAFAAVQDLRLLNRFECME